MEDDVVVIIRRRAGGRKRQSEYLNRLVREDDARQARSPSLDVESLKVHVSELEREIARVQAKVAKRSPKL